MHEASITRDLVRRIELLARECDIRHVVSVKVVLGPLSGLSANHLREHFQHDAQGTVAEGARLDVLDMDEGEEFNTLSGGVLLQSIEVAPGGTWEA